MWLQMLNDCPEVTGTPPARNRQKICSFSMTKTTEFYESSQTRHSFLLRFLPRIEMPSSAIFTLFSSTVHVLYAL